MSKRANIVSTTPIRCMVSSSFRRCHRAARSVRAYRPISPAARRAVGSQFESGAPNISRMQSPRVTSVWSPTHDEVTGLGSLRSRQAGWPLSVSAWATPAWTSLSKLRIMTNQPTEGTSQSGFGRDRLLELAVRQTSHYTRQVDLVA